MKNPVFKARVNALFEKTALGHDPHEVLRQMPSEDSGHLRRGLALIEGAKDVGKATGDVLGAGYRGLSRVVSPPSGEGGFLARGLSGAGEYFSKRPALARTAIGAAALAPILGNAFSASQKQHEAELMNAYADPMRIITASLDDFLEKKAELYSMTKEAAKPPPHKFPPAVQAALKMVATRAARGAGNVARAEARGRIQQQQNRLNRELAQQRERLQKDLLSGRERLDEARKKDLKQIARSAAAAVKKSLPKEPTFWQSAGHAVTEGIGKGVGQSVGGAVVGLAMHGIGTGVDALRDHFMVEPKRKALVDTLLRTDPVLSDAVERHPDTKNAIKESYGTMVRFAPTLSLDINAVRSFLREAVLGGSGVNYATIKNLVDTERAISDAKPNYSFGGH